MPRPNLNSQCDRVWRSYKRAKPHSKRSTNLQRDLVWIPGQADEAGNQSGEDEVSETEWKAVDARVYTGDGGFDIRDLPKAAERATLIAQSVNLHQELVGALEAILDDHDRPYISRVDQGRAVLLKAKEPRS